jgi:hypothetical protein
MYKQFRFCKCLEPISVRQRLVDIFDELFEFVCALTMVLIYIVKWAIGSAHGWQVREAYDDMCDEASDIMFGIGRLFGNLRGMVYVSVPGDKLHVDKINNRIAQTGCCRSMNHPGCRQMTN